uniref:TRIM7 ligase n=1 Tax=Macrostomum lignano TaxID=282301 RepID=A0A1I8FAC9_9PLAT
PWEDERLFSVQPPLDLARLVRTSCAVYSSACAQFLPPGPGQRRTRPSLASRSPSPPAGVRRHLRPALHRDAGAGAARPDHRQPAAPRPPRARLALRPAALEARDYAQLGSDVRVVIGPSRRRRSGIQPAWGICADNADNLVIADRSNNQIRFSGSFLRKFGQRGEGPASSTGPQASVSAPTKESTLPTRITTGFKLESPRRPHRRCSRGPGSSSACSASRARARGEFNYPWDLAVGKAGRLAVADSRNHRIQLFSEDGDYVTEFSIARSPRLCPESKALTARGASCSPPLASCCAPTSICIASGQVSWGVEGQGPGQFCRPQGIAVDLEGNIIICEARNHRLQILNSRGAFVRAFGSNGSKIGQLNRPACVCVLSTAGQLAVVDSENHRVLLL